MGGTQANESNKNGRKESVPPKKLSSHKLEQSEAAAVNSSLPSMDQEMKAINHMRTEKLAETVQKIGGTAVQYKTEVVQESIGALDKALATMKKVKHLTWPKIKAVPEWIIQSAIRQYYDVQKFDPVSEKFNFTVLSVSHFWSVVVLTAKCIGEQFASSFLGCALLSFIFPNTLLFVFFVYILLPIFAVLLQRKTTKEQLGKGDRYILIFLFSFIVGATTHHALVYWVDPEFPPAPFYSGTLVAFLFESFGKQCCHDRRLLLASTVGIAAVVCIGYGVQFGIFTCSYFFSTVVAVAMALYNMQLLFASPNLGHGDILESLVFLPIHSMYNQLAVSVLFGSYKPDRSPHEAIPDSAEEQYSILLRRVHVR